MIDRFDELQAMRAREQGPIKAASSLSPKVTTVIIPSSAALYSAHLLKLDEIVAFVACNGRQNSPKTTKRRRYNFGSKT